METKNTTAKQTKYKNERDFEVEGTNMMLN